jgi:hypothetical protein
MAVIVKKIFQPKFYKQFIDLVDHESTFPVWHMWGGGHIKKKLSLYLIKSQFMKMYRE